MAANPQFDNTNSGVLFKNEKIRSANSPGYTGQAEIACPHCGATHETWVSAWVKEAKQTGKKFFSLAFTAKEQAKDAQTRTPAKNFDDFDDDIPF